MVRLASAAGGPGLGVEEPRVPDEMEAPDKKRSHVPACFHVQDKESLKARACFHIRYKERLELPIS